MESKNLNRQLFFLPALLSIWLIISCTLLILLDQKYFLINILFLILVSVLCLSHTMRIFGWILALVGASVYFVMHISGTTITGNEIRIVSIGAAALIGSALLATFAAEQLHKISSQIYFSRKMIEELRIIEPVTGLTRFHYARKNLNTEIARCQRYNKDLSLLVARISNWNEIVEHRGIEASQQIMAQVGEQFRKSTRNTDLAFINIEKIGVILPETKLEGALHVANRIVESCATKAKVNVNIGVACFPGDAELDSELMRVAESALQISLSSGQAIVPYSEIQEEMDKENPSDVIVKLPSKKRDVTPPAMLTPKTPSSSALVTVESTKIDKKSDPVKSNPPNVIIQPSVQPLSATVEEKAPLKPVLPEDKSYIGHGTIPPVPLSTLVPGEKKENPRIKNQDYVPPFVENAVQPGKEILPESGVQGGELERHHEILVGVHGVDQLKDLPEIEKEMSQLPYVIRVDMMNYANKTLVLNITHASKNFLEVLKENWKIPFSGISSGDAGIEITLK